MLNSITKTIKKYRVENAHVGKVKTLVPFLTKYSGAFGVRAWSAFPANSRIALELEKVTNSVSSQLTQSNITV